MAIIRGRYGAGRPFDINSVLQHLPGLSPGGMDAENALSPLESFLPVLQSLGGTPCCIIS
jgi:hypothetical protein